MFAFFLAVFMVICSTNVELVRATTPTQSPTHSAVYETGPDTNWNYNYTDVQAHSCSTGRKCGPSNWWRIPSPAVCGGSSQTPIDFTDAAIVQDTSLVWPTLTGSTCENWDQFSDNHAFEVAFPDCVNTIAYGGLEYKLLQFHFHAFSEHTVNGENFDAELHLVHKNIATGNLLVVGRFVEQFDGVLEDVFASFWNAAEKSPASQPISNKDTIYSYQYAVEDATESGIAPFNPYKAFLPSTRDYWTYSGSLTTPPCTEGVTWVFLPETLYVTPRDLMNLKNSVKYYGYSSPTVKSLANTYDPNHDDFRPVQPLNSRVVSSFEPTDSCYYQSCTNGQPCQAGTQCVWKNPWYSQCLQTSYKLTSTCIRTRNSPDSGSKYGCQTDADCCNPFAWCVKESGKSKGFCELKCNDVYLSAMPESSGSSIGGSSSSMPTYALIIILVVGAVALFATVYYAYYRRFVAQDKHVSDNDVHVEVPSNELETIEVA